MIQHQSHRWPLFLLTLLLGLPLASGFTWTNITHGNALVSYYDLDAPSTAGNGTTLLDLHNQTNGTLLGNPTVNASGFLNQSYNFTTAASRVNLSSKNVYNKIPFSITLWATNGTSANYMMAKAGDDATDKHFYLYHYANDSLEVSCFTSGGAGVAFIANKTMHPGWNFIGITYDSVSGIQAYMSTSNDYNTSTIVLVGNRTGTCTASGANNDSLYLHGRLSADGSTDMAIDEVGFYNTSLNRTQMQDVYRGCYNTSNTLAGYECLLYGTQTRIISDPCTTACSSITTTDLTCPVLTLTGSGIYEIRHAISTGNLIRQQQTPLCNISIATGIGRLQLT